MSPNWAHKPEAIPYSELDNPQSLNLYDYMRNNPLGGFDEDGHWPTLQQMVVSAQQTYAKGQKWTADHPRTMSAVKATGAALATAGAVVAIVALAPEIAVVATVAEAAEIGLTAASYGVAASGGAVAATVYGAAAITGDPGLNAAGGAVQTITNPAGLSGTILSGGSLEVGGKAAAVSDVLTGGKDAVMPTESGVKELGTAASATVHTAGATAATSAATELTPADKKKPE